MLVALALSLGAVPEGSARLSPATKTYRAEVVLHPEPPTVLTEDEDNAAWGVASFGRPFSSLDEVCVSVRFSDDLLDPGETFHFLHFYFHALRPHQRGPCTFGEHRPVLLRPRQQQT